MDTPAPREPTTIQVILGVFILAQLTFLLLGNFAALYIEERPDDDELSEGPYLPRSEPASRHLTDAVHSFGHVCVRWGELTGQAQRWSLFTPWIPLQGAFLTVELRWDEPIAWEGEPTRIVRLDSLFEPERLPPTILARVADERLLNYENRLSLPAASWDEEYATAEPTIWRDEVEARIRLQQKSILAFLRWNLRELQRQHPDIPHPREVVLLARVYPTPPPGRELVRWEEPTELRLARWQPELEDSATTLPIEMFDPIAKRFERLPKTGGSGP